MLNNNKKLKVGVGLSGGLDSSVTCLLLKQQGYEVVGITAKMVDDKNFSNIIANAKAVAKKIGIKHEVIDLTEDFDKKIINYFIESYKNGETPNPCILCNRYIKWGKLFNYAIEQLNCDFVSSGHYAKIIEHNGKKKLYPAKDINKDQQYYLFELNQKQLSKILFPLSDFTKEEIRKIAIKNDLPSKSAKESQDICFIKPPMTTKKYLNNILGNCKGDFVERKTGKVLGHHDGFWQYTIGQRKGIGLAAPEALYVVGIEPQTNTVYVGYKPELDAEKLILNNIQWSYSMNKNNFEALVKIRYNMKAIRATINISECVEITFLEPVSGITSGQACVIYDIENGHLLGGGFI